MQPFDSWVLVEPNSELASSQVTVGAGFAPHEVQVTEKVEPTDRSVPAVYPVMVGGSGPAKTTHQSLYS